jgi:DNA polymerase ligase (LigD)-like protein
MPRFVVLLHETPAGYPRGTHFDLMLEHGNVLRTWALNALPVGDETTTAEQLPDHRTDYLDYEGEVSGERGQVSRVDAGEYDTLEDIPSAQVIRIRGQRLQGILRLVRDAQTPHRWRISLSPG